MDLQTKEVREAPREQVRCEELVSHFNRDSVVGNLYLHLIDITSVALMESTSLRIYKSVSDQATLPRMGYFHL